MESKKYATFLSLLTLSLFIVILLVLGVGLVENNSWQTNLTGVRFSTVAFGDLNNDNRSDLLVTGCLSGAGGINCNNGVIARIYINNGTTFNESVLWQQNLTAIGHGSTAFGDIDNDGRLDLAITGCTSATSASGCTGNRIAKIYINNGTSLLENSSWGQNLTGTWFGNLALADIDNDGRLDLALIGRSTDLGGKITKIYINNGSSLIENIEWQQDLTGLDESSLTFGDINNDGRLDLAVTGEDSNSNKMTAIYINNGSSLIENSIWQENLSETDQGNINFGDIDNDADIDILLMGCCDLLRTYINNGSTFLQSEREGDGLGAGLFDGSTAFGDYDNDGDLDFVGVGFESGRSKVYKNNGTGDFSIDNEAGNSITTDDFGYSALAWNDIDNDGDLDLTVIGTKIGGSFNAKIYVNNASLTSNNSIPTASITFSNSTLANGDIFLSWGNGSDAQTPSNGLYYNLRVGTISAGNQIISGIYGGSSGGAGQSNGAVSGYFGNMMQRKNISLKGSRFQVNTTYYWSVQTIDTALAKSEWSAEKTFNLTSDFIPPVISINSPGDNIVTNITNITFNALVYDANNLTNVSLYGNWTGTWHRNQTNSSGTNNTNYTFNVVIVEGTHLWGIRACDYNNNCISVNQTFRIDTTFPIVNLITPSNGSSWTTANVVNFTYNVSDLGISNCSLMINGLTNRTNTSIGVNQIQNFTTNLPNGNYNWSIRCADSANNVNFTGNYSLTVSYTAPSGDGGSPGGGGGSSGSGGGGGGSTTLTSTNFFSKILAGIPAEAVISNIATNVNSIKITTKQDASDVKISVIKLSSPLTSTAPIEGIVFRYLEIKTINIPDNILDEIKIKFNVDKSWLAENNALQEDVILKRFNEGKWKDLNTGKTGEDSVKVYYQAESPGLSYFVIALKSRSIETNPEKIQLELLQGEAKQEKLDIKNLKNEPLDLEITLSDSLKGLVVISEDEFKLDSQELKSITLDFIAGINKEPMDYIGTIKIKTKNEERNVPVIVSVKKREALFDIKIDLPLQFKTLFPGDDLAATIQVINVRKIGKVDVLINYFISDLEGNVLTEASDTISIEDVTSFIRGLSMPSDIIPGDYFFNVNLTYKGTVTQSRFSFEVKKFYPFLPQLLQKNLLFSIGLIVLISFIFVLFLILRKKIIDIKILEKKDIKILERKLKKRR